MKIGKIDTSKINKEYLYVASSGKKYLDVIIMENRGGPDQYGNDGFIAQGIPKEARDQGVKGAIIGNWKHAQTRNAAPNPQPKPFKPRPDDDISF